MKKLLIPFLVVHTLVTLVTGSLLFLRVQAGSTLFLQDGGATAFVGAMVLSPLLAILVATVGPQRPEGLLRLEDPFASQSRSRAKARLKTFLRLLGLGFFMGLLASLYGALWRHSTSAGGMLLASFGCLMVVLSPWVALYARWFRINWF